MATTEKVPTATQCIGFFLSRGGVWYNLVKAGVEFNYGDAIIPPDSITPDYVIVPPAKFAVIKKCGDNAGDEALHTQLTTIQEIYRTNPDCKGLICIWGWIAPAQGRKKIRLVKACVNPNQVKSA